jgi:hypothetical protein
MQTNTSCPIGWTRSSELSSLFDCDIPIIADQSLKGIAFSLGILVLIGELITLFVRIDSVQTKGGPTIILIVWTLLQNIVMVLRPGLGLLLNVRSETTLWMAFITHISGATASGLVILYIYIELEIIEKSSMKKKVGFLLENKGIILIGIGVFDTLFFLVGPLISYYTSVPLYQMFWAPVVAIDFTVIPYFCFLSGRIYIEIKKMIRDDFKKLSRQILITGFVCSGIGLFTGGVGIYLLIENRYEWAFIELCWISDIIFNCIIFAVLVRRRVRQVVPRSSEDPTVSAHV